MRNLSSYFTVIFDSPNISDEDLRRFTEVHLKRLALNNPGGIFTGLLATTTTAYDAYFGSITDRDTRAAVQRGLSHTMNSAIEEFILTVRRCEAIIEDEFPEGSLTYEEFFPLGLEEYNEATMETVEALMTRFVNLSTRHARRLGQPFVDRFAAMRCAFVAARAAQSTMANEGMSEKLGAATARHMLEDQLMDNLLTLAMNFKRDPLAGMLYFEQSILQPEDGLWAEVERLADMAQ